MRLQVVITAVIGLMGIASAQTPATPVLNLKGWPFQGAADTYDR